MELFERLVRTIFNSGFLVTPCHFSQQEKFPHRKRWSCGARLNSDPDVEGRMLVRAFEYEDNFPYNYRYKPKGEISFEIEWEFKYQIPSILIKKGDLITTFTKDGRFQFDNVLNGAQELVKFVET